jgi:hypothetical protein
MRTLTRVSVVDSTGGSVFIADTHRDDGKRFVVRADEKLTAFVELGIATSTQRDDFLGKGVFHLKAGCTTNVL